MRLNFWHRHTFDPGRWELVNRTEWYMHDPGEIIRITETYKNTCLTCGDLVVKMVEV